MTKTEIAVTNRTEEHIKRTETYGAHNYHPLPVVIDRGEGVWVWDVDGKKYMDCLSAYSAVNQGHGHAKIRRALVEQSQKVAITSRAFHNAVTGMFFEKLAKLCKKDRVLAMNSGAEAVETAVKMARKWGYEKKGVAKDAAEIIVFEGNFHGRTTTIVGFSDDEQYKEGFGPFTPGFKMVPYGEVAALEKAIDANTVAVLIEPLQGEGGVNVPPAGFLRKVREITERQNVLFLADEIQSGLGRTGRLFCCDHENVVPDAYILGKALSGGFYPVSAVVANAEIMDVFRPGDHGSTFGANPIACAVASAAIDVLIEEKLPERAGELGDYFMAELEKIGSPLVKEVRGRGLLIGVELTTATGPARPFCEALMRRGLLCKETHEMVIRFAPPLVVTKAEIDWAVGEVSAVLT